MIWERMTQPANMDTIARRIGCRYGVALESYRAATVKMSATLGYVAPAASIGLGLSLLLTGTQTA